MRRQTWTAGKRAKSLSSDTAVVTTCISFTSQPAGCSGASTSRAVLPLYAFSWAVNPSQLPIHKQQAAHMSWACTSCSLTNLTSDLDKSCSTSSFNLVVVLLGNRVYFVTSHPMLSRWRRPGSAGGMPDQRVCCEWQSSACNTCPPVQEVE